MSKILTRLFHSSLLLIALFCGINSSSQTVIFNEGIGAISATTPIATWTGWTNGVGLTFSNGGSTNSADLRATSVSSGYSGASGVGNVFFTSTAGNYGFSIGNIQASAYSNLQLYFAYRKESGTALPALAVSYSIDGGLNYTPLTYTFNQAASATVGWYTAPVISLPAAAQVNGLRLKWEKSGSQSVRIDDIKLMGTLPPSLNISGTPSSLNTTQGSPSAETTFSVSASNLTNDLLVSAPSGFEVSLTSGSGFASTLTITPTAGSVTSTTIYIRLTAAATGSYSGNIVASSAGASDVNLSMPVSTVGSSVAQDQSISFATFGSVTYGDANITLGATATSGLTVEYTSSNTSVAQISGNVLTIVGAGTANIIAAQAGDANYNPAPSVSRSLVVNPATLTISNPLVTDKVYNGDNLAVITGTLSGVIGSDVVNLVGTGTFASTDVANGISVTSTSTLSGAQAGNYSLVQPTGLSGNIIGGIQTITFNALPQYSTATSTFTLSATSNATGATIEYTSSNTSVATVTGNIVTIVGSGTTNITASSASVGNYAAASNVVQALNVISAVLAWDFTGVSAAVSTNPTYVISGLGTAASSALTRGAGAAASSGGNSFRTTGFQNNGISLANTDYFQWTVSPQVGTAVSLSSIDARFVGTASFYAVPGVTSQFAYSTDGTLFTLIGSPVQSTSLTMSQVDLSGVTALQNIQPGSTVTFRYYASGQTTTGGWGFSSPSAGVMGLILGGTTTALPCPFYQDNDGDGYGNPSVSINATCGSAQTGYVELNNTDCNDNDNTINPGATELPCNTTDDNCNGSTNENSVAGCNDPAACNYIATATCSATCDYTQQTYYQDLDADGYGNNLVNQLSCSTPFGYVLAGGDCDDNNPGFNPGAVDVICNGGDENCNGTIDDGAINGCMDVNATNYDATATCNSGCTYVNFTAGNVVVYRIGSGTGALSAAATPSYLDEFNATGLVRSLSVPTSGVNRLTNNGSSTSEGLLGRTADQSKLVMAGYDAAVATASVISAAGVNRVINTVGISPSSMTRLASGTYYASANFRGACVDGNNAWGSGSNTGITYFGSGTPAIVSTTTTNTRYISVQNGQLYYSTGSGTSRGVYKVGTGMPLVSSTTSSVVINQGGTGDPYGFQFSLDGNTCYIADNTTGIEKWTYNGATWSKALTISLGTGFGAKGLAVDFYAGVNPRIYALATSATQTNIVYLDDNGTTTPTINTISTLTTASANKAYRGIAFAPCTPSVWYADADGDGYGALANTLSYCTQPYGYVANSTDCDDAVAASNPAASEICDGLDNDCDGTADDGLTFVDYYNDQDGDSYGAGTATNACQSPGASYVTSNTDCDDAVAASNPAASEICDGLDNDCDGTADDGLTFVDYYNDQDGDSYGAGTATNACQSPGVSYVTSNNDCDDNSSAVNPSAAELCNGVDDDCSGTADNGLTFVDYYNDADGDTYGAGTATNACQSPGATYVTDNTDCNDANNAINPSATDVCNNSIDEDCSGEDCVSGINAAISILNIGQFGTGVQATQMVNLASGTNTIESPGVGNDLWYSFVAQNNAIRISLTGSTTFNDDNDLGLYNAPANINAGVQLIPIATENDVHPTALGVSTDGGNEIMYYSNLITGNTYYILVRNNNATPGVCSLTVSYLRGSQTDIGPYTNYTGVYGNTCQNFKAAFRPNGTNYTVNRWADITATGTPIWTYVIPANSTICQLGKILPPNMTGSTVTYPLTVDVTYNLPDAFGNMNTVNARGNVVTGVGLSSEASLFVRAVDACPAFKSPTTGSIATNRSVCGIDRYEWQFTEANSTGTPIGLPNVNPIYGPAGASRVLYLATVPGIAGAKFYNVKIRTKHTDGVSLSSWGNTSCVKTIGAAGMVVENNDVISNTLSNGAEVMLYPNPNNGQGVNVQVHGMDGDVQVRLLDGNGRLVKSDRWIVEGSLTTTLDFDQTLSTGLYQVEFIQGNARTTLRMSVVR